MDTTRTSRWLTTVLWIAIIGGVILRLATFTISTHGVPAFDDECKIALQAKQIARGECALLILASPYIFPLDAYLMAPFVPLLPRDAFGVRVIAFVVGLITLCFSLLILRRWGPWRDVWPGAILVLFGSTYLLALQNGCALPGYYTLLFLSAFAVWLAERQSARSRPAPVPVFVAGLAGGLACSETMLSLPILLAAGAMLGLHRSWRTACLAIPLLAAGILLGLLPHIAAKHLHPDAFSAVQGAVSWHEAVAKFRSPVLDRTLPAALGISPPIFPDTKDRVGWLGHHGVVFGLMWLAVAVAATLLACIRGLQRWRQERWPSLDAGLVFAGISWMCLGLFLLSGRSHSHTYRYFAPLVWTFPFLVAYLYRHSPTPARVMLGALALVLAGINAVNTAALLKLWRDPGFATTLKSYDLQPALRYLDQKGIRHGYATYVDAYRFTWATDERITVCQPYNERFPGWLVPYKSVVDAATPVAYILSDTYRFPPDRLEEDMRSMGVTFSNRTCGRYVVFTDFARPGLVAATPIPRTAMAAQASHNAAAAGGLIDGTVSTFWRCDGALQQTGMWVAVTWNDPRPVQRVRMDHGMVGRDHARSVELQTLTEGGEWITAIAKASDAPAPFEFINGRPVYGRAITELNLASPVKTKGLRIRIVEPRQDRAWTINELEVLAAD